MSQITFPGLTTLLTSPMTAAQTSLPVSADVIAKLILGLGSTGYTWLTIVDDMNIEVVKAQLIAGGVQLTRGATPYAFPVGACALWEITDESVKDRVCNPTCVVDPLCPCVVPTEGATAVPNGMRELPWEGALNFLGTAPMTLTIIAAPSFVTYTIGSNFVKFSGTPTVSGVYSVSVKATNACGTVTVTKAVTIAPKASDSTDCATVASTCSGARLLFKVVCAVPPVDPQIAAAETRMGARLTMNAVCGPCPPGGCADTIVASPTANCPDVTCTTDSAGVITCITKVKPGFICSVNSLTGLVTCVKTPVKPVVVEPFPAIPEIVNPISPNTGTTSATVCSKLLVSGKTVTNGSVGDYNSQASNGTIAISVTFAKAVVRGTAIIYDSYDSYTSQGIGSPDGTATETITVGDKAYDSTVNIANTALAGTPPKTLGVNGALKITIRVPGCTDYTYTLFNRETAGGA